MRRSSLSRRDAAVRKTRREREKFGKESSKSESMSDETACEDLSSALQTARQEPLSGGDKKTKTIEVGKKSVEFHTSNGSSSRSTSRSPSSPVGNLLNPKTVESGKELQKITKDPQEEELQRSERNGENIIEDKVSSGGIKLEEEKRPLHQLKMLETRSQYHSIQQLSSPSIKSNESISSSAPSLPPLLLPPRISYKISDIVTPSEFCGESGKHSSFSSGGNRDSMENGAQSSEDEDNMEVQKRSRKMLHNGRVMAYGWRSHGNTQKQPVVHRNQRRFSDDDDADEEEEFLQANIRCGSESFDDLSDMEMSDGGSGSHDDDDGSVGGVEQREAAALENNVEDSSHEGHDVADEFVLTEDAGYEGRMEAKRARVENIIKTMTPLHKGVLHSFPICRSFSAVSKLTENRDKEFSLSSSHHRHHDDQAAELRRPKRKQYIPQQVDPRGSEQLDHLPPAAKVCITERDAVCHELLKMQEGLNDMQHKYRQMIDGDHEVSYDFSDREGCKERSQGRSEKGRNLSDVNQNDVKSISREFRQAFNNGGEWALNLANEKEFGHNGSITNLEQLTKILKTEITIGVERLVDNFLKTFLRKYLQNNSRGGTTTKSIEMLHRAVAPATSRDDGGFGEQDLRIKDEPLKMDNHIRDKGTSQQLRGDVSGTGSRVRDDFSGSGNHGQEEVHMLTDKIRDNPSVGECKRKAPTPLNFTAPSYHAVVSRTGADVSSHLPTLPPPPPPLTMQPPFQIHGSMTDVSRPSLSCEQHSKPAAEKYREHFFDAHHNGGGAYGIQQSHLSLFGPPHPHIYYSPCIGKFPPAFVKEQEQMEPLPLIVGAPKKPKRSKVIDRVSPRAVRSLPQETATQQSDDGSRQLQDSSPGRSFHPRYHPAGPVHDAFPHPSLLPFGLAPSVALHNSSLQQHSTLLQAMYSQIPSLSHREKPSSLSSPNRKTQPFGSPSDMHVSSASSKSSSFQKCESAADAAMYDQMMSDSMMSVTGSHGFTSTLTPMHLRKAKLMFFYVRYPSSAILKVYFPDVKFNKNNTAQLVKWFSNFREFYYIQMEKYARQALVEGVKTAKDLVVTTDAELYRILVVHYNRNCQIEVPENFRYVVQATLREFYTSIVAEKDQEPSWKKAIYKVIARMDDPVPDYFKSPNWMERLADG